jgi:hypothetical protein
MRLILPLKSEDTNMKRAMYLASGISVLFTTLAFAHIMIRETSHALTHDASAIFLALHTIFVTLVGVLSLIGAYFLLTGWRRQNSN